MRSLALLVAAMLLATTLRAQTAGPPRPVPATRTPVELTGDLYRDRYGLEARATTCAPARAGEIVVCGGRSPYRVPLPDERDPPDHPRLPTGEIPRAAGGDAPVRAARGAGLAIVIPLGRRPAVTGLGDQVK